MEDPDALFDLSKKKKKKKKTPFDLGFDPEDNPEDEKPEKSEVKTDAKLDSADAVEDFSFDPSAKKKKKKKALNLEELGDNLPADDTHDTEDKADGEGMDENLDFNLPMKKKKKKKLLVDTGVTEAEPAGDNKEMEKMVDSDRDYTYDELLKRVFDIMREKNPEMVSGEKKRFVMKPPQVMRAGAKKVAFTNFSDICKMLHRQPKHFMAFLLAELGTSGSIDGSNQLIIKGKFQPKQVENVLRHYIKEYVTCHTCKSPETILQRDTRLYFLQCETCGSRCSVASIKSGFQAVTGKRAAMRAKTT